MSAFLTDQSTISTEGAALAIAAAVAEATDMNVPVTVVVLEAGGNLKALVRMDGAPLVSVQTATSKANAAAAIGTAPDDFFNAIKNDAAAVASFATRPGLALIGGGLPLYHGSSLAGSIGVAGAMTAAEDRRIADVAVAALAES
jgi:glc operon protein GlcG